MTKAIIRNDQVFRGRYKGTSETHCPNDKFREVYDTMTWGEQYWFCESCKRYVDDKYTECPNCNQVKP